MPKNPWFKFYHGDWRKDGALDLCTSAARGVWIELIAWMHEQDKATITGPPALLARACRCTESELQAACLELKANGVATVRDHNNGSISVTSSRVQRDMKARKKAYDRGLKHKRNASETKEKRCKNALETQEKSEVRSQSLNNNPLSPPSEGGTTAGKRKVGGKALAHDKAVAGAELPEHIGTDENVRLFAEFCAERRLAGKYMTERAVRQAINKLAEFEADEVKTALQDAIAGGYAGVFPRRKQAGNQTQPEVYRNHDDREVMEASF